MNVNLYVKERNRERKGLETEKERETSKDVSLFVREIGCLIGCKPVRFRERKRREKVKRLDVNITSVCARGRWGESVH